MTARRLVPLLALLAVSLVGCGGSERGSAAAGEGEDSLAALAPASSAFYVEAVVRPEGELREDLLAAVGKLGGTRDPEGLVAKLLSDASKDEGATVDYRRDVEPWLGQRAAAFGRATDQDEPRGAVAIATRDVDKARSSVAAILKREEPNAKTGRYKDTPFTRVEDEGVVGFVGDVLVIADEGAFGRAVDTAAGAPSLEKSGKLERATKTLAEPRLVTGYVDTKALLDEGLKASGSGGAQIRQLVDVGALQPTGFGVLADGERVTIDSALSTKGLKGLALQLTQLFGGAPTKLVGQLPGDTVGAYGIAKVGAAGRAAFREVAGSLGGAAVAGQLQSAYGIDLERDVFAWIGDVAGFIRGSGTRLEGGVVISTTDATQARQAITRLVGVGTQKVPGFKAQARTIEGTRLAYEIGTSGEAGSIWIGLGDDRVVAASSRSALEDGLEPPSTLDDSDTFQAAQEALDETAPVLFADVPKALGLIDAARAKDSADWQKARPYLARIAAFVQGTKLGDGLQRSEFSIRLR